MHRWRTLAVLAVALLCLMLFGPNTQAQQAKPSEPEESASGKKPPFEDDVIVRPKGKGFGKKSGDQGSKVAPVGFEWSQKKSELERGDPNKFRCDLYEHLVVLQAAYKANGKLNDAVAVKFDLEGYVFEVAKDKDGNFKWTFYSNPPKPCKMKMDCAKDGVPSEFIEGKKQDGTIKAKFAVNSDWETVEEVLMHGAECK